MQSRIAIALVAMLFGATAAYAADHGLRWCCQGMTAEHRM